jgi:hypothetical protein
VIVYIKTFKTDVIVFIGNVNISVISHLYLKDNVAIKKMTII